MDVRLPRHAAAPRRDTLDADESFNSCPSLTSPWATLVEHSTASSTQVPRRRTRPNNQPLPHRPNQSLASIPPAAAFPLDARCSYPTTTQTPPLPAPRSTPSSLTTGPPPPPPNNIQLSVPDYPTSSPFSSTTWGAGSRARWPPNPQWRRGRRRAQVRNSIAHKIAHFVANKHVLNSLSAKRAIPFWYARWRTS